MAGLPDVNLAPGGFFKYKDTISRNTKGENMEGHYFAADGNFGEIHGLVVCDTESWTEEDWQQVENASDNERASVALAISNSKEQNKV
jgi:hypothetical protein